MRTADERQWADLICQRAARAIPNSGVRASAAHRRKPLLPLGGLHVLRGRRPLAQRGHRRRERRRRPRLRQLLARRAARAAVRAVAAAAASGARQADEPLVAAKVGRRAPDATTTAKAIAAQPCRRPSSQLGGRRRRQRARRPSEGAALRRGQPQGCTCAIRAQSGSRRGL